MPETLPVLYVVEFISAPESKIIMIDTDPKAVLKVTREISLGKGVAQDLLSPGKIESLKIWRYPQGILCLPESPNPEEQIKLVYWIGTYGSGGAWELPSKADFWCEEFQKLCEADET